MYRVLVCCSILASLTLAVGGCGKHKPQPATPQVDNGTTNQSTSTDTSTTGQTKKALLVGINRYPGAPLNGCVPDVKNVNRLITVKQVLLDDGSVATVDIPITFNSSEIRMLTDEEATTKNILDGLAWLNEGAKAGDIRLFWYSGHGAEFAGSDVSKQPDGLNQIICPVDFDWTEEHMIKDVQFNASFGKIPSGVLVCWGSDSCHSGDLTKDFPRAGIKYRQYPNVPQNIAIQIAKAKKLKAVPRGFVGGELEVCFIGGCKYNEYSADTQDALGNPCGAMTHYFLQLFAKPGNSTKPTSVLVSELNTLLDSMKYDQHPTAEGSNKNRPFLR